MKKIICPILLLLTLLYSSFEPVIINPASVRKANISGFSRGDIIIPHINSISTEISAGYFIPFGLSELSYQHISWTAPVLGYGTAVYFSNFGNSEYRENVIGVSVKAINNEKFSLFPGIQLYSMKNLLADQISFGLDLNSCYSITDKLKAAVSVKNIYRFENDQLDIPMTGFLNLQFSATDELIFFTGVEKSDNNKAVFKTALEYIPIKYLNLSAGYNFEPELLTTGFSLNYRNLVFNYALSYHFELDYSHAAGFIYEF